jgi:hypothetical protein
MCIRRLFRTIRCVLGLPARAVHFLRSVRTELHDYDPVAPSSPLCSDSSPNSTANNPRQRIPFSMESFTLFTRATTIPVAPPPPPRLRSYREILNRYQAEKNLAPLQARGLTLRDLALRAAFHVILVLYWLGMFIGENLRKRLILDEIDLSYRVKAAIASRDETNDDDSSEEGGVERRRQNAEAFRRSTRTAGRRLTKSSLNRWQQQLERWIPAPTVHGESAALEPDREGDGVHEALRDIQIGIDGGQVQLDGYVLEYGLAEEDRDFDEQTLYRVSYGVKAAREKKRAVGRVDFSTHFPLVLMTICKDFARFYLWCVGVRLKEAFWPVSLLFPF